MVQKRKQIKKVRAAKKKAKVVKRLKAKARAVRKHLPARKCWESIVTKKHSSWRGSD